MDKGYVYILVNKSMPGLVKIGQTTKSPEERAKELSSPTGVPTPFEVAYALRSFWYENLEKQMHAALADRRSNNNREFFEVSVDEAKTLLNKLASPIERILNFFGNIFRLRPQHIHGDTSIGHSQGKPTIVIKGRPMIESEGGTPKLGINGKPYYSPDNGFHQAKNANGIPESIRDHINIIINNEELAINADHEFLKEKIRGLSDEIKDLKEREEKTENSVIENQTVLADNKLLLDKLKTISALETSIDEKNKEFNNNKAILAGHQEDLSDLPPGDSTSQHRPLRLYPLFGVFCVILSFALYFFYISAIDKGYLSNLPTPSESQDIDLERYTQLNDIFDPSSIVRAFQKANLWLIVFPFFALGLALVIHPLLTYGGKYRQVDKKSAAIVCWIGAFLFVIVTFIFDCILALQVSKKIHEAKVLFGLEEGDWPISPLRPGTWDLNIWLVLFCGFLVSLLLSVLFHFTLEMWKEARTQDVDDRIRTKKEIRSLETKLEGQEDAIRVMTNKLESAKEELKSKYSEIGVSALGSAEIVKCESNIELLTERIKKDSHRIESIQSEIKKKQDEIEASNILIAQKTIDIVKLKSHVSEFVAGWTKFLAAAKEDAAMDVEIVQQIAERTLSKHLGV